MHHVMPENECIVVTELMRRSPDSLASMSTVSGLHLGIFVLLRKVMLSQEGVNFRRAVNLRLWLVLCIEGKGGKFH